MHRSVRPVTLVSLAVVLTIPRGVFALGQLTQPIEVKNARRGQVIEERLILNNSDARELSLTLAGQGDIADWATFFLPGDRQTSVTRITIAAKSNLEAYVKIAVPDDARNGTYQGTIQVSQGPGASELGEGVGAVVALSTSRRVTITVTDTETIAFTAQVIPEAFDVRPGEPLNIKILYRNEGNVEIRPRAHVSVKQDARVLGETIYPYPADQPPVKPREEGNITVQWPTYRLAEGKYRAYVTAGEGEVEQSDDFAFSVSATAVPPGGAAAAAGGSVNRTLVVGGLVAVAVVLGALAVMRRRK